eukprot:NODE_15_length_50561_cov_0.608081.p4 type:complete len:868 gc:universal NODE_15_length_50561_cov_0.608081:14830-17433(+)
MSFIQQIYDLLDPELSHLNPHPIYEFADDEIFYDSLLQIIMNDEMELSRQQLAAILVQQTKSYKPNQVKIILNLTTFQKHQSIREYLVKGLCQYSRNQWYNIPDFFNHLIQNIQIKPREGLYCLKKILKEFSTKKFGKDLPKLYEEYQNLITFLTSCYEQCNEDILLNLIVECGRYCICWSKIENSPSVYNFVKYSIQQREASPSPKHYKSLIKFHSDLFLSLSVPVIEGFPSPVKRIIWLKDLVQFLIPVVLDTSSHLSQQKSILVLNNIYQGIDLMTPAKHPLSNFFLNDDFIHNLIQYILQVCRFDHILVDYELSIEQISEENDESWEFMALSISINDDGDSNYVDSFIERFLKCLDNPDDVIKFLIQFKTDDIQVIDVILRFIAVRLGETEENSYMIHFINNAIQKFCNLSQFNLILLNIRMSSMISLHPFLFQNEISAFFNTVIQSVVSKQITHPLVIVSSLYAIKKLLGEDASDVNLAKNALLISLNHLNTLKSAEAKCECLAAASKSLEVLGKEQVTDLSADIIFCLSQSWQDTNSIVKPVLIGVMQTMTELMETESYKIKDPIYSILESAFHADKSLLFDDSLYLLIAYLSFNEDISEFKPYVFEVLQQIENGVGTSEQIFCFYKVIEIYSFYADSSEKNTIIFSVLNLLQYCEDIGIVNASLTLLTSIVIIAQYQKQDLSQSTYQQIYFMATQCLGDQAILSILSLSLIAHLTEVLKIPDPVVILQQCIDKWDNISDSRYQKLICMLTCTLINDCTTEMLVAIVPYWSSFLLGLQEVNGWDDRYLGSIPSSLMGLGISTSPHEHKMIQVEKHVLSFNTKKMMGQTISSFTDLHRNVWNQVTSVLDSNLVQEFQRALLQ